MYRTATLKPWIEIRPAKHRVPWENVEVLDLFGILTLPKSVVQLEAGLDFIRCAKACQSDCKLLMSSRIP